MPNHHDRVLCTIAIIYTSTSVYKRILLQYKIGSLYILERQYYQAAFGVTALDSDSNALRSNLSDSVLFEICLLSYQVRLVAGPGDGSMLLCSMYLYLYPFFSTIPTIDQPSLA